MSSKKLQVLQPFQFYQPSEGSQSSLKFPSETNMGLGTILGPNQSFRVSEPQINPYMMSNNELIR